MNYKKVYDQIIDNRKANSVEGYLEKHHIIPRSLGGTDDNENLIELTAREHFLCHFLLAKMYEKESFEWYKMNHAFMIMKCNSTYQQRYFNSRLYEALRKNFSSVMSLIQTEKGNSNYGNIWICNLETKENKLIKKDSSIPEGWIKGRNIWNYEQICPICEIKFFTKTNKVFCSSLCKLKNKKIKMLKGYKKTDETRQKMSKSHKGKKHKEETKEKIRTKAKDRITSEETKVKLSEKAKIRARNNPLSVGKGTIWINNGKIAKRVKEENIIEGWKKGRLPL